MTLEPNEAEPLSELDMNNPTQAMRSGVTAALLATQRSAEQQQLIAAYLDVICGDCESGRCHGGGWCGCARHEVSVRWRDGGGSRMTPEQLTEIKARLADLPTAPWHIEGTYPQRISNPRAVVIAECYEGPQHPPAIATFIAHARTDVPELLGEVEQLRLRPDPSKVLDLIAAYRTSNLTDQGFADLIVSLYGDA